MFEITLPAALFLFVLGFLVGIVSGLIGIGGGVLVIPAMLYIYPWLAGHAFSMQMVTGVSATQTLSGSASATLIHHRNKNARLRLVFYVGIATMSGGYLGGISTGLYSDLWLKILYALLLLGISAWFFIKPKVLPPAEPADEATGDGIQNAGRIPKRKILTAFPIAVAIGYFAGLIGIGGAVMVMPLMHYLLGISIRIAIGSAIGVVFLTSIATFAGKFQSGLVPLGEAAILAIGALVGGIVGARISVRLPERLLRNLFIGLILVTLVRVLMELVPAFLP